MTIKDLIAQHKHFIPLDALPVLPEDDTLSDALDTMRGKRTHLIAIQGEEGLKLLWTPDMLDFCLKRGPIIPWAAPLSTIALFLSPAPKLSDSRSAEELMEQFTDGEEAVVVIDADDENRIIGVATREENAEGFILTLPSVAECIQGHLFAAPGPRDCPFDGTPIM